MDAFFSFIYPLEFISKLFHLSEAELNQPILDYCPGPSSFTASMRALGRFVIAADPLYTRSKSDWEAEKNTLFDKNRQCIESNLEQFEWKEFKTIADFDKKQKENYQIFLDDYEEGKNNKHYLSALSHTHQPGFQFALIRDYFFTKRFQGNLNAYLDQIEILLMQANELRIYPLLDTNGEICSLIGPLILACQKNQLGIEIREVPFIFQKRGNAMLRIWKRSCELNNKEK